MTLFCLFVYVYYFRGSSLKDSEFEDRTADLQSSLLVIYQPAEQILIRLFSGGHRQNDTGKFLLCVDQFRTVDRQKNQHGMSADTLVPIQKGMIFNQAIAKPGCFLREGRISLDLFEALERSTERRVQQPFLSQSGQAAGL